MAGSEQNSTKSELKRTPLHALHVELGAKMVPFAGYDMPVTYPEGLIKEHLHTREAAGLFDVSHMGQALITADSFETAAAALETLVPGDILSLAPSQQRYTQLLNTDGGIIDDLMITRLSSDDASEGELMLVVNAARKDIDFAHIGERLPTGVRFSPQNGALLALQGPAAAEIMRDATPLPPSAFMTAFRTRILYGMLAVISRSGYTGEDGFEISLRSSGAEELARYLLAHPKVKPIGLGARDTLRLEAGLCLYGHDIDEATSPVEADLVWSIGKRRRDEGGFPGAERIQRELRDDPARRRVGLRLEGRAPAREGCEIVSDRGEPLGRVTSGSFAPSVGGPIAMGYVAASHAGIGTRLAVVIRGTPHPASVVSMPFTPHRYYRKTKSGTKNG